MTLQTLYARTAKESIQQWTVTVQDNRYCTTFGQVDGKMQTTNWTDCFETNGGRSNQRSPQEQALFEANALWKKKKDSGYFENIEDKLVYYTTTDEDYPTVVNKLYNDLVLEAITLAFPE